MRRPLAVLATIMTAGIANAQDSETLSAQTLTYALSTVECSRWIDILAAEPTMSDEDKALHTIFFAVVSGIVGKEQGRTGFNNGALAVEIQRVMFACARRPDAVLVDVLKD